MRLFERLRDAAHALDRAAFVAAHAGMYLVKQPLSKTISRSSEELATRSFDTEEFSRDTLQMLQTSADHRATHLGPWAPRWMVWEVRKRTDLYPERISIGRTAVSDIVVPFGFISKLQGHLYPTEQGALDLVDRSSNGTLLDGRPVPQGEPKRLYVGCRLQMGPLELDLYDASSLHQTLRRVPPEAE